MIVSNLHKAKRLRLLNTKLLQFPTVLPYDDALIGLTEQSTELSRSDKTLGSC